ncbi:MAG: YdcF family protein, partial [Rhodospirillales bacterium]
MSKISRRRQGGVRRFPIYPVIIAGLALAAWGTGLFMFAAAIPTAVEDGVTRTDAIVVLTGGSGRLGEGLDLMARDRAS